MTRKECQVKFSGEVGFSLLIELGAELLGRSSQKDIYLCLPGRTRRIRIEGDKYIILTEKGNDIGGRARLKEVAETIISKAQADKMMKECREQILVCKNRTLFQMGKSLIAIDEVEHLGNFVEVRASNEEEIFRIVEILGFNEKEVIRDGYFEMMKSKNLPKWIQLLTRVHEKIGELSFGITSGILTTLGLMTGVNAATSSQLSVIAAIASIAVADSFSDAFGMYMSKVSERGNDNGAAIRYAAGTLAGKFIFPLTFIVPVFLFPLGIGIAIDLVWGGIALALLSAEQAIVSQASILRTVGRNLSLAVAIIILSMMVGSIVSGVS